MLMRSMLAILALGAAACSSTAAPSDGGPAEAPDQCRASQHQHLVGRNRSEIPAQPDGATWRITCTTCPVTMDYNPRRMNILFDEQTGVIREVSCG